MRIARRLAVLALCATALAACNKGGTGGGGASAANGPSTGKFTAPEYVIGNPNAPVKVVEYLSDTCVHCAAFAQETFPKVKAKYIDTGKVSWTIREFLTPPEQVSAAGFVLARCAGRDKYYSVIEAIFHSQDEMFKTGDFRGPFQKIAKSVGMSDEQFTQCLSDDAALTALSDRVQKAINVDKIESTPTFLINGKKVHEGEYPFEQIDKALQDAGAK